MTTPTSSAEEATQSFNVLSGYFNEMSGYYIDPTAVPLPYFPDLVSGIGNNLIYAESYANNNHNFSYGNGARIQVGDMSQAVLREAALRAKVKGNYYNDGSSSASTDAEFLAQRGIIEVGAF